MDPNSKEKELDLKRQKVIQERIKSEFKKHGNAELYDWTLIAAIKINQELKNIK